MKRVVAVLLVFVMMLGMITNIMAESSNDETYKTLKALNDLYKASPMPLDADYLFAVYMACQLYITNQYYESYNSFQTFIKTGLASDNILTVEKVIFLSRYHMTEELNSSWVKWLNDEIDDAECTEAIMAFVDKLITMGEE